MCFYNSQSKRAMELAKRYGRKSDILEMVQEILDEQNKIVVQTFSILTVPSNELCSKIHNGGKNPGRMPLIIGREKEEKWLNDAMKVDEIVEFFVPFDSGKMDAYPVSKDFLKKGAKDKTVFERAA